MAARSCVPYVAGMLPPGKELVIGLTPPFGKNNILANKFVQHAAQFLPRVIVLIVPPQTPIPRGYTIMYEDHQTMSDRCGTKCYCSTLVDSACWQSFQAVL